METKSLKALAHAVLERNRAGNDKETLSFQNGNSGGIDNCQSFPDKNTDFESILRMPLSVFRRGRFLIRVKCTRLDGEEVFIASSEREAVVGRAEGLITYTSDELIQLCKGKPDPGELKILHTAKKELAGTLTEIKEREI